MNYRALRSTLAAAVAVASALALATAGPAAAASHAGVALTQVSSDPYRTAQAQHATEVEPTLQHGSTILRRSRSAASPSGGASNIGWSLSTDGGEHLDQRLPAGHHREHRRPVHDRERRHRRLRRRPRGSGSSRTSGILSNGNVDVDAPPLLRTAAPGAIRWPSRPGRSTTRTGPCATTTPRARTTGTAIPSSTRAAGSDTEDMSTSTDGGASWSAVKHPADSPSGSAGSRWCSQRKGDRALLLGQRQPDPRLHVHQRRHELDFERPGRQDQPPHRGRAGGLRCHHQPLATGSAARERAALGRDRRRRQGLRVLGRLPVPHQLFEQ